MDLAAVKAYCLARPGAHGGDKPEWDAWVGWVGTKMFALVSEHRGGSINLKCDPIWAQLLRQTYAAVEPGYHMNKQHWNTVLVDGSVPDDELKVMIDHSHQRVVAGLTKRERAEAGLLSDSDAVAN